MLYHSTRNEETKVGGSRAILEGLAPDGGLYVPDSIPKLDIEKLLGLEYKGIAKKVVSAFFDEFSEEDISRAVEKAYGEKFDSQKICPVKFYDGQKSFLELSHGPTLAFKDLALSLLPYLMALASKVENNKNKKLILAATSGDTGKAAMEAFSGLEGYSLAVFYPDGGVSNMQERQMLKRSHKNVRAFAVKGNFDDCQTAVKEIFSDKVLASKLKNAGVELASANSINIGRLIPQIVYYFDAYRQYLLTGRLNLGDKLDVVVPTGNFGNVLAAFYAKEMGLDLGRIGVASNSNKVLADFSKEGIYDRNRDLIITQSPSIDILISSNLERYLYLKIKDAGKVAKLMDGLKNEGRISLYGHQIFEGDWADEEETSRAIKEVMDKYNYLIDPHTAVAYTAMKKLGYRACMVLSTASPYKFPDAVLKALGENREMSLEEKEKLISKITGGQIPKQISGLFEDDPESKEIISIEEMMGKVEEMAVLKDLGLD